MEKREQQSSTKKARVEGPGGGGRQDAEGDAAANVAGALVPTEAAAARAPALTVLMDMDTLHCPRCTYPFKTPIFQFQCEAGHLACHKCHADLPKDQCHKCAHAGAYIRSVPLENVVGRVRILCPYEVFGCGTYVLYNEVEAHQRQCPFAPCGCLERRCPFQGTPAILRRHVADEHPRAGPVLASRYGVEWNLTMEPAQQPRKLFFAQEDGSVFVASRGALSAGTEVTLVCVRANGGAPATQYTCKLALEIPAGDGGDGDGDGDGMVAAMVSKVRSSALTDGAPAPDHGVFFGAYQELLATETISLKIRIDPIQVPATGAVIALAAAGTPKSAPAVPPRTRWMKQ